MVAPAKACHPEATNCRVEDGFLRARGIAWGLEPVDHLHNSRSILFASCSSGVASCNLARLFCRRATGEPRNEATKSNVEPHNISHSG
jgi:hypothetical protein